MRITALALFGCLALHSTLAFLPSTTSRSTAFTMTAPTTTSSNSQLFSSPKPLAEDGDWIAYLDEETTGVVYYFNSKTGQSLWEAPEGFPPVYMKPSQRRKAESKKEEYFKAMQETQVDSSEKKKSFMAKLLDTRKEEEAQTQQAEEETQALPKEEEPEWMKDILEEKYPDEEEKPGFFSRLLQQPQSTEPTASKTTEAVSTPTPAPVEKKETEPPKKGLLDGLFGSINVAPTAESKEPKPFFTQEGESAAAKAARVAEEERVVAEQKAAAAKAAAEQKAAAAKSAEEQKMAREEQAKAKTAAVAAEKKAKEEARKLAEEERKMMAEVRKAEVEQKAEAKRLAAEARKVIEENKRAERAAAAEAKKAEAAAKKAEAEEAKRAAAEAKRQAEEEKILVAESQAPIKIEIGSCVLPHPSKVRWGGEDAVFCKGNTFGVFDGVSGADKAEGLPLYSKMLAKQMTQLVGDGIGLTVKDMQNQLLAAAEIADAQATGASTAVVASITDDGFLRAINLGDSSCIVIRGDKVVQQTSEIVHYFDCPYQLSEISPDRPRDARKMNFELVRGDIILMASDGIFDNLSKDEIVELAKSAPKANTVAKKVSERSRKVSLDSQAETPYASQAKKNGDPDFRDGRGGKVDDISCVVVKYE